METYAQAPRSTYRSRPAGSSAAWRGLRGFWQPRFRLDVRGILVNLDGLQCRVVRKQTDDLRPDGGAQQRRSGPGPARVGLLVCVASICYIGLFAAIDGLLETYAETAHQVLIQLLVVSMALLGLVVVLVYLLQRAWDVHEQGEGSGQLAGEDARPRGALLGIREVASWLPPHTPLLASAVRRASIPGVVPSTESVAGQADVLLLTPREREVAILIAQGRTSSEIADELVIAERTADTHADRIRSKLGVRSRTGIVAWVLSQGLLPGSTGRCVCPMCGRGTVEPDPVAVAVSPVPAVPVVIASGTWDWRGYLGAVGAVAVMTALLGALQGWNGTPSHLSILYILAVLATAVAYGRGPALACSVLAFVVNDYLFTPPIFQFSPQPYEWLRLGVFVVVALVTAVLARGHSTSAMEDKLLKALALWQPAESRRHPGP